MAIESLKEIAHEFCPFCGNQGGFTISENAVLLREARCEHCGASLRNSDVAREILKQFGNEKTTILANLAQENPSLKILNTCSSGHIHEALKMHPGYIASEHYRDIPSGEKKGDVICVDLCDIPFEDSSFDLIITEDVFEHIDGYEKAFGEIQRVLRPNGHHIFTVPLHEGCSTISRIGNPKKIYHGDPLDAENGCIVMTDFGDDILQIIDRYGGHSHLIKAHIFYKPDEITNCDYSYDEYLSKTDRMETYFKYNSIVIDTVKANDPGQGNNTSAASAEEVFTGERFVPGIEDVKLSMEHYQRYYGALALVKGKDVLDAACGEGYGTALLSSSAARVTGIDISADAVRRAKQNYSNCENVDFIEASIAHLPIADHSIDVVVSFETIEHVEEEIQWMFLGEIARVLKEDGILIMSTPNKEIYSDRPKYHNEFHIKEFYRDEFLAFLHTKFSRVSLYDQFFENVCIINAEEREVQETPFYCPKEYDQEAKYYIAVAGNCDVSSQGLSHIYVNPNHEYDFHISRILQLQDEVEERNRHLHKLDGEIEEYRKYINILQGESERGKQHEQRLSLAEQDLQSARKTIVALCNGNESLKAANETLQETNISIKKEWELCQAENSRLKEAAIQQQSAVDSMSQTVADLRQTILNKEGHIQLLLETEREYEREKHSRTYRMALMFRRISTFFLPVDSKRRFFCKLLAKGVRHPIRMLHMINPRRIKNCFTILKTEGTESAAMHLRLVEEFERSGSVDAALNKLDIASVEQPQENPLSLEEYSPLRFAMPDEPLVSIIIPAYNQFDYTYHCMESIQKHSKDVAYEILLADDCSTDLTGDIEQIVTGIRHIRTENNLRFLRNCNHAAKQATGKYILFLNNDTQVQENWLQPLVDLLESDASIGMTGSKLVYPDGHLQEAGGILWKDASAWNYGHMQNPEDPEFNYVKEADFISGASIMIRRNLWEQIGGFDERFAPAYYEDADLAFEVRRHGYKVVYQPLSVVVHFEGISNGTDLTSGQKKYQVENRQKFYDKWKDMLEAEHFPNGENVFLAKDRSRGKKQILVVDHYVPHYDKDAGGKCTYMYLLLFVRMGLKVTFIGDNFYKHEPYTTDLNQHWIEVLYGTYYYNNWEQWLKDNLHYFDYVYLQRPHISIKYIDLVKQYGHAKVFYYDLDLHHVREYREYLLTHDEEKLKSSERWKKIEYELFEKADVGHVVGSYEESLMQEAFPGKPIRNIPLYIYDEMLTDVNKNFDSRHDLLFVGGFGHPPNTDAVLWFSREVFPKILEKYPDMKWHVVGGKAPEEVQSLASSNILIEGFLPDEELHSLYHKSRIAVVPLRVGAGVKGKVVEAAYFQIPLVTTTIGAEGLDTSLGNMLVEDDADRMAKMICELYEDQNRLREMSDAGEAFIRKHFTVEVASKIISMDL